MAIHHDTTFQLNGVTSRYRVNVDGATPADDAEEDGSPPLTPISDPLEQDTPPTIRRHLADVESVTATEAAGLQIGPVILAMHATTLPKIRRKHGERVKQGHALWPHDHAIRPVAGKGRTT